MITQNVDDLHIRVGTLGLVRLHGSLWELSCWRSCGASPWRNEDVPLPKLPPLCPSCGALARPAVVWFGEALPTAAIDAAVAACECDVFLSVGTSSVVYPAAAFLNRARSHGAFTVEINTDTTPATSVVDLALTGPADQVLPRVERLLEPISGT